MGGTSSKHLLSLRLDRDVLANYRMEVVLRSYVGGRQVCAHGNVATLG